MPRNQVVIVGVVSATTATHVNKNFKLQLVQDLLVMSTDENTLYANP